MADQEIRFVGDLQRMDIRPGDKFVLSVDGHITRAQAESIRDGWRLFAGDVPLLILEDGMKLGAIRDESDDSTFDDRVMAAVSRLGRQANPTHL